MKRKSVILLSLFFAAVIVFALGIYLSQGVHEEDWKQQTTPLPKKTVVELCTTLQLPSIDPLCNTGKPIYGLEFFDAIQRVFRPFQTFELEPREAATYQEVEQKLGNFKYECEPVVYQADGFTYFVCYYDLRGDREFIIAIVFTYPNMAVARMTGTSRFGD